MRADWLAYLALLVAASTPAVAVYMARASRRKTDAEARRTEADIPYSGGEYIKNLSEASMSLMAPLRIEIELLRARNLALEVSLAASKERNDALELDNVALRRSLLREREERDGLQEAFEARLRSIRDSE